MILTSIYGTAGAIVIGVPIGFLMAVFLSKVANRKLAAVIREVVDLLAGIPSVVYGLVGMMVLVPAIRDAFNLAAGDSLLRRHHRAGHHDTPQHHLRERDRAQRRAARV